MTNRDVIRSMLIAFLVLLMAGCVSHAHGRTDAFSGEWGVEWCDKADPKADCGGFSVSLAQDGDRLCGSYSGARVRLTQIDEGGSRAIRGVVVGDTAVLTIESGRSGAIYLISAGVRGDRMRWTMRETVREADQDIGIIATDDELVRRPLVVELSKRHADTIAACRAVNMAARAFELLSPQDRALFDQTRSAVQRYNRGLTEEQTQNIAAAGLAEYRRRETQVQEPQDIAVYGDRLFTSYFPHGQGREPMFHANVRLEDAASIPARESVQQMEAQARQQTAGTQEREREQQ